MKLPIKFSIMESFQVHQLLRFASMMGLSLFAARYFVDKNIVASFEIFLWLTNIFSFFWINGFFSSFTAHFHSATPAEKERYFSTAFFSILLMSLLAVVGFLLVSFLFPHFLSCPIPVNQLRWMIVAYLLLNGASYIIDYYFFLLEKTKSLVIYAIVFAVFTFVVPAFWAWQINAIVGLMYGLLLLAFVKYCYLLSLLKIKSFSFDFAAMLPIIKVAVPLMLTFLVAGSGDSIDSATIKYFFSNIDFTLYRYGAKELPLFYILAATLSTDFVAKIAQQKETGLAYIKETSIRYMVLFFMIAIVLICLSPQIFAFLLGDSFMESATIFNILLLTTIPRLLFPQSILTGLKDTKMLLYSSLIEMAVNIVLSIVGAFYFGLLGVAYATVAAFMIEKVVLSFILYKKYNISIEKYTPIAPFVIGSTLLIVIYIVCY